MARAPKSPPMDFVCGVCEKPFQVLAGLAHANERRTGHLPKYCSKKCNGVARRMYGDSRSFTCEGCGDEVHMKRRPGAGTLSQDQRFCSRSCYDQMVRNSGRHPDFPEYKANENVARNGYIRLAKPWNKGKKREAFLHRLVMEKYIGRSLFEHETVHQPFTIRTGIAPIIGLRILSCFLLVTVLGSASKIKSISVRDFFLSTGSTLPQFRPLNMWLALLPV